MQRQTSEICDIKHSLKLSGLVRHLWWFSASLQSCLSCLRLTVSSLVRCIFPALWLLFLHPLPSAVDEVGLAQAAILNPASSLQLCPGKSPPLTMRSAFLPVQSLAASEPLRWMLTVITVLTFAHQELE